VVPLGLEPRTP